MQNRHCRCSVVYKNEITTSYCIITASISQADTQQYKHTFCSSRERQHDNHSIHSTKKDQCRTIIAIVHSVYEGEMTTSFTAPITNNTTQFKHIQNMTNKRTYCSPRANATPVPYMYQTNDDQRRTFIGIFLVYLDSTTSRLNLLRPHIVSNINNTCQIVAHTRSNTNVRSNRPGPTRHRHSINEDQCEAVVAIVMYLDSA